MLEAASPTLVGCVRLPHLPLDAHHGVEREATRAHAVHTGRGHAARLVFVDPLGTTRGLQPGMALSHARCLDTGLASVAFDPARLAAAQGEVIQKLLRLTPRIASGGTRRFWVEPVARDGSFATFCRGVASELEGHHPIGLGLGPTATVAYAAARASQHGARIIPSARATAFLDECDVAVLDLPSDVVDVLASIGVRTVRALRAFDPVSLGMRFGPEVAAARRRAEGHDPRGPAHPRTEDPHEVTVELPHPAETLEPLVFLLRPAVDRWLTALRGGGLGATEAKLALTLVRPHLGAEPPIVHRVVRAGAPFVEGRTLLESLRTVLEREPVGAAVTAFTLSAGRATELRDRTLPLLPEGRGRDAAAREVALTRLRARLGPEAVRRASHVPASALVERAAFTTLEPRPGEAMAVRRIEPPLPVERGRVHLAGRDRLVLRTSLVERTGNAWWVEGDARTVLYAHAELEGPMLVLLRGDVGTDCADRWEAIAYLD